MPENSPISVVFLIFPQITQLDVMGPAQVLSRLGNASVKLAWKTTEPVITDSGFPLLPTHSLDEISKADIICIPGGFGTIALLEDNEVLDWVRKVSSTATWITSVCTGALVLGAAGLLKGYKATTHWASLEQLAYFGAIPTKQRVVFDRTRVSGGGVTSGIDFALSLTEKIRGADHAKFVQLSIEYDPMPPFDAGTPEKADPEILNKYFDLVSLHAPDRDAKVAKIASELGFNSEP